MIASASPHETHTISHLEQVCFSSHSKANSYSITDSEPWSSGSIESELRSPYSHTCIYYRDLTPIAYIIYRLILNDADILRLGVLPQYRKCGVASELISYMYSSLGEEYKAFNVTLEVSQQNTTAISFYQNHGFKVNGIRENYYRSSSAYNMLKKYIPTGKSYV